MVALLRNVAVASSPTILSPSACRSFANGRLPAGLGGTGITSPLPGRCAAWTLAKSAERTAPAEPESGRSLPDNSVQHT